MHVRAVGLLILGCFALAPLAAAAHAMPVSYTPESAAVVDSLPQSLSITFSERIDARASSLVVRGPNGTEVETAKPKNLEGDVRTLTVPVRPDGDGTYVVSWSAVSSDDGHFTKGAYAFGVGKGTQVVETSATSEIVKVATKSEALAMTVELAGNGLLWAALLLFVFVVRKKIQLPKHEGSRALVERGYLSMLIVGAFLGIGGGVLQLYVKTLDLASLQAIALAPAFLSYIHTTAGMATIGRIFAVASLFVILLVGRKRITSASRITLYEVGMIFALLLFAYFRAKISHATANPFFPDLSIFVNIIHLVEKDIWFGILVALTLIVLHPRLREFLHDIIQPVFLMLAINLGMVSVTASYIVWLHLKSFGNVFTTEWGSAFLVLLLGSVLLVGMRAYHTLARLWMRRTFTRLFPATIACELALALFVVYASSVIIITSPPLPIAQSKIFTTHSEGVAINLVREGIEDSSMHLYVKGAAGSPVPFLSVRDTSTDTEALSVPLQTRYDGAYAFPVLLMQGGDGPYEVTVDAPQKDGYDAHAVFTVDAADIVLSLDPGKDRSFDTFTVVMIAIACMAFLFALVLYLLARKGAAFGTPTTKYVPAYYFALPAFLVALYAVVGVSSALAAHGLLNPFKAQCEGDGNMWHSMLPTRAGVPVSQVPVEGCMWGMGDYPYLISDGREYAHLRSLGPVEVTLLNTPSRITTGTPVTFTVMLKDKDGAPALLYKDMEKLLHMVIVSEDQTVFAHIHPDDKRSLTAKEISDSTFTLSYTFPKAGRYSIATDYAHGITLGSKQFIVEVAGNSPQAKKPASYPSHGTFGGYEVNLTSGIPTAGTVTTLIYDFTKDGTPVTSLTPYLSAAMHVAVIKNDLSEFAHTHGELHPPGQPYPPVIVKDGKIIHSMASMETPPVFGPRVEAHVIFPSKGRYTVWGQFKVEGSVIPTAFTVDVE